MSYKNLFFFVFSLLNLAWTPCLVAESLKGKILTKKSYELFFENVLLSDRFSRPALEAFDPAKATSDLKSTIRAYKKNHAKSQDKAIKTLQEILKDFPVTDKKTLERILLDFHAETSFEQREGIYKDWKSSDLKKQKQAERYFFRFIKFIDYYDVGQIHPSKRKGINLFHEILNSETIGKKEINLLRKILSQLGLPSQTHHDQFLKLYLISLKEKQIQSEMENNSSNKIKDQKILELLEKTKTYFDDIHFNNLSEMSRFKNIIKGFPAQYILFQAAIGATIYREHITDPLVYDAYTKPGYIEEFMAQSLTPSSAVSFLIFIMVSQKTNYWFYKGGRHFDKKFLKVMAPHAGLASGFFISALTIELYQDRQFRLCASSLMSEKIREEENGKHISACEESYAKWLKNKWSDYAVDIINLLGASWMSHKIVQAVLIGIRSTSQGGALLYRISRSLGTRVTGWVGFFITIYAFMESYHLLDKFLGQPIKKYLKLDRIQSEIFMFNHLQEDLKKSKESENLQKEAVSKIKVLGRQFQDWFLLKVQDYQWSFSLWLKKTNKMTLFYQQSKEMLSYLYEQSQTSYDFVLGVTSQQEQLKTKGFLVDRDIFHKNRDYYGRVTCLDPFIAQVLKEQSQTDQATTAWNRFCDDPENINLENTDLQDLAYESFFIIFKLLKNVKSDLDFTPYLGETPEELLSSDPNHLFDSLNFKQKLEMAQSALRSVYDPDKSFIHQAWLKDLESNLCLQKSLEEKIICETEAYLKLRDKILAFAIFSLKEVFAEHSKVLIEVSKEEQSSLGLVKHDYLENHIGSKSFDSVFSLLDFLKVYKKGEIFFDLQIEDYNFLKKEVDQITDESEVKRIKDYPYVFFKSMMCGFDSRRWKDYFVIPQLFKNLSPLCETKVSHQGNFQTFHKELFDTPVEWKGKRYSHLWMLLEDQMRSQFQSKKDLISLFEDESQSSIEEMGRHQLSELKRLNDNYLIPNMINFEVQDIQSCSEILNHYNERNLKALELKGLEASLFQIIYWLQRLENHYGSLSSKCEIVELLKSYHDTFIKRQGPFVLLPRDKDFKNLSEVKELSLKKKAPVLVTPDLILTFLLDNPSLKNPIVKKILPVILKANLKAPEGYDAIEYALLFELKLSLDSFFQQINFLRIKENVEESLAS